VAYSSDYPDYSSWSESGPGITPVFVSSVYGTLNRFATQDTIDRSIILLNSTDSVLLIKDVIVTYQYMYDFYLLGRAVTDSDSIYRIEGSSRVGNGLFAESETDSLYKTEVMLPEPSTRLVPDVSGAVVSSEYSDHNLGLVAQAIRNTRRQDAPVDLLKYGLTGRPYRIGQEYHQFFERS
jgi:hypothetical protein